MDGLNRSMPGVFVRMNDVETSPGRPPRVAREKQLVDPAWANQKPRDCSVIHPRIFVVPKLRENMKFVSRGQPLNERQCITLSPTSRCRKIPTQNGNLHANVEGNTK
jgi:hypothetical protein